MKLSLVYGVFFILIAGMLACKHEIPFFEDLPDGGGNTDTVVIVNPDPCNPDTIYFENTILPLLISKCAQPECHDAITHEKGIRLYNYSRVMSSGVIEPGDPDDSDIMEVITEFDDEDDIMPPPPSPPLTAEQIGWIQTWIEQGARNNSCIKDCDPEQFSFSANIFPVIQLACQGCHGVNGVEFPMTNYEEVGAAALDGRLMNALRGTDGYELMPYNTGGLPQCNIDQFQAWVDAGAPNN